MGAQQPFTNATGAAMMARLVVRMTKTLARHKMPDDEVESAVEELMADMGETFGGLGAAQEKRPFVQEKSGQ